MRKFFKSSIGRLRLLGFLEGLSLLVLVFISVPIKHLMGVPQVSSILGPLHGVLFLLFIFNTLSVGVENKWSFKQTTWKILLACMIPFGTFYIDREVLKPLHQSLDK